MSGTPWSEVRRPETQVEWLSRLKREDGVRDAAHALALAELEYSQEYLRYIAGKTPSWQAEHMARVKFGLPVRQAEAELEIAKARLRA